MYGPSNSSYSGGGSGGIEFAFLDYLEEVAEVYPEILAEALEEALEEHENALKERARRMPAWRNHADGMSVSYSEDGHVEYHVATDEDISGKEYGDLTNAPAPLFRSFALREGPEMIRAFENKMKGAL